MAVDAMLRLKSSWQWMVVLVAGVAVRVALAPFTGHPYDLGIWMVTGQYLATSWRSPYELIPSIGYPPLWALWCAISYMVSNALAPYNEFLYIFIIKIPIILADILVAYLLVRTSKGKRAFNISATRISAAFLLNPYVFAVGVVWSMMDNLVGLLVVCCAICMFRGRFWWAGMFLALSVALKLYPLVLLPICLAYILRYVKLNRSARITHMLFFLVAFSASVFVSITLPFLIFGWDKSGFLGLLFSQVGRAPGGGIAPMSVLNYFLEVGVSNVGPVSIIGLYLAGPLRLIWISATLFVLLFVVVNKPLNSFPVLLREFALTYSVYLLVAPWVSEQMLETLLILMLFIGASEGFKKLDFIYYFLGSAIVFVFLTLHVPVTSFLFPIVEIDPMIITSWGMQLLPWLVLLFGVYLAVLVIRGARQLGRILNLV